MTNEEARKFLKGKIDEFIDEGLEFEYDYSPEEWLEELNSWLVDQS